MLSYLRSNRASLAKLAAIVFAVFFVVLFLFLGIKRVLYQYELEWMEGPILEHALRIFNGQQLYVKPTIEFVNWLYQPLYYYVTAGLMTLTGVSYLPGRLVSFGSTLALCGVIYSIVRTLTDRSGFYPFVAVGLYLASYQLTGYSFDIARVDALLGFLLVASVAVLFYSDKTIFVIFSAVLLTLAIFTKQQAFIYALPPLVWLYLRRRSSALIFLATLIACFALGTFLLYSSNGEWYFFFVYTVPKAKAATFGYFRMPFVFSKFVFSNFGIGSITVLYCAAALYVRDRSVVKTPLFLIVLTFLTSIVQLALHLGDQMSFSNVALPFAALSAIAFAVAVFTLSGSVPQSLRQTLPWLVVAQFAAFMYNPYQDSLVVLHESDSTAGADFLRDLKAIPGTAILQSHSFMPMFAGKHSVACELATADVMTTKTTIASQLQQDWDLAFEHHRFDAIVTDESYYSPRGGIPGYKLLRTINIGSPCFRSNMGSVPTAPRYVYVPNDSAGALQK